MATKTTTTEKTIDTAALLEGLEYKERPNGTVVSIHRTGEKATVAELCRGKKLARLNFRVKPTKGNLTLGGQSNSWPAGGIVLTADNLKAARAALLSVTAAAKVAASKAKAAA